MESRGKKVLVIIVLLLITIAGAYYFRVKTNILDPGQLITRESLHFVVHFREIDEKAVDDVIKAGEDNYGRITGDLNYDPGKKTEIYLYPGRKDFEKAVGSRVPSWVVSATKDGKILIQSPFTYMKLNEHSYNDIFKIVPHEFTHLLVWGILTGGGQKQLDQQIPAWFIEGTAYHEADQVSLADLHQIKTDYDNGRLLSIKDMQNLPGTWSRAEMFYKQSGWLVRFMSQKYGQDSIRRLLDRMASGKSFNDSLIMTYSLSQLEIENEWHEFLRK